MAQLGQCKTCRRMVSTEAISCPHCGQPDPAITIPPDGTAHSVTIERITHDEDGTNISFTFQNGLWAIATVRSMYADKYKIGQIGRVKVTNAGHGAWGASLID